MIPTAVTTAPRRHDYLPDTLASLAESGFPKPIIFAERGAPVPDDCDVRVSDASPGSWPNFRRALAGLVAESPHAVAYAVFQDDIAVTPNCAAWVESRLWPSEKCGVLSLYTAETTGRGKAGWFQIPRELLPRRAFGACAIIMPCEAAKMLGRDRKLGAGTMTLTDQWLGKFCKEHGLQWWQHQPSLIRHLGEVSSIKRPCRPGYEWDVTLTPARQEGQFAESVAELAR